MSYKDLIYSVEEQIATITLNRPDRMNALSRNLEGELHRAFDEADGDSTVKVMILTGNGRAFCAPAGIRARSLPAEAAIRIRKERHTLSSLRTGTAATVGRSANGLTCGGSASRSLPQ